MDPSTKEQLRLEAARVFTPAVPVSEGELFAGRIWQIQRIVDVINTPGQHAVIFGERGVGKTSLANIIGTRLAAGTDVTAPRVNCDSTDDFASIWRKVLAQIQVTHTHQPAGFRSEIATASLPAATTMPEAVTPDELRRALGKLGEKELVVVILDEFDRVTNQAARRSVADTIKTFADHAVPVTVVIVGVADTIDELVAEHRSIERALVQIPMRRMTTVELEAVLAKGVARLERSIDRDASLRIARLSQGLPHFTHLLGLHAVRAAIDDDCVSVGVPHVRQAILRAVADSEQSLARRLEHAGVGRTPHTLPDRVLLAAALASSRGAGDFTAADVKAALATVHGQPVASRAWEKHLDTLCQTAQGPVLVRSGDGRQRQFRFEQPLLQPILLMRGLLDGEIREADLPDWLGTSAQSHGE